MVEELFFRANSIFSENFAIYIRQKMIQIFSKKNLVLPKFYGKIYAELTLGFYELLLDLELEVQNKSKPHIHHCGH